MIDDVKLTQDGFYRDDAGRPYVRVSNVLKEFGFVDSTFFDPDSRERGSAVHLTVKFRLKGTLNEKTLDPQLHGWVDSIDRFMREKNFVPHLIEATVRDPLYRFAGRLDLFGLLDGRPAIIDNKSGKAGKAARLQTGAYARCVRSALKLVEPIGRYALELKNSGDYSLVPFPDDNEETVFAGMASTYWYKYNLGMIKKNLTR